MISDGERYQLEWNETNYVPLNAGIGFKSNHSGGQIERM